MRVPGVRAFCEVAVCKQCGRRGLVGGEVQPGSVPGGAARRPLAAANPSRQRALPGHDHHLRPDPDAGEGGLWFLGILEKMCSSEDAFHAVLVTLAEIAGGGEDGPGSYHHEGQGLQAGNGGQCLCRLRLREGWPELSGVRTCDFGFRRMRE